MAIPRRYLNFIPASCLLLKAFCYGSPSDDHLHDLPFHVQSFRPVQGLYYANFDANGSPLGEQKLRFRSDGYSQEYRYQGPRLITFYLKKKDEQASAFASVHIPQNVKKPLLIFLSKDQFPHLPTNEIICLDLEDDITLPGHIVFINTMPATFTASTGGEQTYPVLRGINKPIPISPEGQVKLAIEMKDLGWQIVYGTQLPRNADHLIYIVLYPPPFSGGLDLRAAILRGASQQTEPTPPINP